MAISSAVGQVSHCLSKMETSEIAQKFDVEDPETVK